MSLNFTGVYFTGGFFTYLESTDESLLATATPITPESSYYEMALYHIHINKGFVMLFCIVFFEWPKGILEDLFHKVSDEKLSKIRDA